MFSSTVSAPIPKARPTKLSPAKPFFSRKAFRRRLCLRKYAGFCFRMHLGLASLSLFPPAPSDISKSPTFREKLNSRLQAITEGKTFLSQTTDFSRIHGGDFHCQPSSMIVRLYSSLSSAGLPNITIHPEHLVGRGGRFARWQLAPCSIGNQPPSTSCHYDFSRLGFRKMQERNI